MTSGRHSHAVLLSFFFQAEDGIRDLVRSRGLGDVYKRQLHRPGQPCLTCHGGKGPGHVEFSIAGTLYKYPDLSLIHI